MVAENPAYLVLRVPEVCNMQGVTVAAIYARISQSDPKVEKTADQVKRCRALADREGYEVAAVFVDDGISAFTGKARPGWLQMIDGIAAKRFDVVLAVAEDRLARDSQEKIGYQVHCAKYGVVWHTLAGGRVDPSTAEGSLMSTITGAIAQYESHVKRERMRASVVRRLAEGKDLGGPRPFGFEDDRFTIRGSEAVALRGAYDAFLETGSVYAATVHLNRSGHLTTFGKEWGWSSVRKMLARKRNAGILESKGQVVAEGRPAIVSREVFDSAQILLGSPVPAAHGPKPGALGSGIVLCGRCDSPMSNGGEYYRCATKFGTTSPDRSARKSEVKHPTISRGLLERLLRERTFMRLVALSMEPEVLAEGVGEGVAALRGQIAEVSRRRDVAQELAFMPGANMALLGKQMAALQEEIARLEASVQEAVQVGTRASVHALARDAIRDLGEGVSAMDGPSAFVLWEPQFMGLPMGKQRLVVSSIFTTIRVGVGGRGAGRVEFDWPGKTDVGAVAPVVAGEPF